MTELITKEKVKELKLVKETKAKEIKTEFDLVTKGLVELEKQTNAVIEKSKNGIDKKIAIEAKTLRNKIVKVRTLADKKKKELTSEARLFVGAVNGTYKVIEFAVKSKEDSLKKIETAYEEAEQAKLDKIRNERIEILKKYEVVVYPENLEKMSEEIFLNYVDGCKAAYNQKKEEERIELERIEKEKAKAELEKTRRYQTSRLINYIDNYDDIVFAELSEEEYKNICDVAVAKRTEHEAEQERIKKENEKLKAEAEERKRLEEIERKKQEELLKIEREKAEKEKKELELKLKAEAEEKAKIQAELKAKEEKEKAKLEKELNAEREEKAKIKAELEAKEKAEQEEKERIEKERIEKIEAIKNTDDNEKIKYFIGDLSSLEIPKMELKENQMKIDRAVQLLNEIKSMFE